MMLVLLVFLVPLAALLIFGVVFDLRQRRRALGSHDINAAVRIARANTDGRTSGLTGGGGVGGV